MKKRKLTHADYMRGLDEAGARAQAKLDALTARDLLIDHLKLCHADWSACYHGADLTGCAVPPDPTALAEQFGGRLPRHARYHVGRCETCGGSFLHVSVPDIENGPSIYDGGVDQPVVCATCESQDAPTHCSGLLDEPGTRRLVP